jgi:hypothetical protein
VGLPMDDRYEVTVAASALRSVSEGTVRFPHRWTSEGVTVQGRRPPPAPGRRRLRSQRPLPGGHRAGPGPARSSGLGCWRVRHHQLDLDRYHLFGRGQLRRVARRARPASGDRRRHRGDTQSRTGRSHGPAQRLTRPRHFPGPCTTAARGVPRGMTGRCAQRQMCALSHAGSTAGCIWLGSCLTTGPMARPRFERCGPDDFPTRRESCRRGASFSCWR